MWSMWDAPSDRDYYGDCEPPEQMERCYSCGADDLHPCEEWCDTNRPAEEPAPVPETEHVPYQEAA